MGKPEFCLGTAKLGIPDYGISSSISSRDSAIKLLHTAERVGIRSIDTAQSYGNGEKILGLILSSNNINWKISSKISGLKPNDSQVVNKILNYIKNSLNKLKVKKLHICYLHQDSLDIISDQYIQEGLIKAKQLGLVKYIGVSLYNELECDYAVNSKIYDVIQIPINIVDSSLYNKYVKNNRKRIKFVARSIFLQGLIPNYNEVREHFSYNKEVKSYMKNINQYLNDCELKLIPSALQFVFSLKGLYQVIIGTIDEKNLISSYNWSKEGLNDEVTKFLFKQSMIKKVWSNPRNWI